jgi:hypothetical protein
MAEKLTENIDNIDLNGPRDVLRRWRHRTTLTIIMQGTTKVGIDKRIHLGIPILCSKLNAISTDPIIHTTAEKCCELV